MMMRTRRLDILDLASTISWHVPWVPYSWQPMFHRSKFYVPFCHRHPENGRCQQCDDSGFTKKQTECKFEDGTVVVKSDCVETLMWQCDMITNKRCAHLWMKVGTTERLRRDTINDSSLFYMTCCDALWSCSTSIPHIHHENVLWFINLKLILGNVINTTFIIYEIYCVIAKTIGFWLEILPHPLTSR